MEHTYSFFAGNFHRLMIMVMTPISLIVSFVAQQPAVWLSRVMPPGGQTDGRRQMSAGVWQQSGQLQGRGSTRQRWGRCRRFQQYKQPAQPPKYARPGAGCRLGVDWVRGPAITGHIRTQVKFQQFQTLSKKHSALQHTYIYTQIAQGSSVVETKGF